MTRTAVFETSLHQAYKWLEVVGGELGISDRRSDLAALRAGLHALRDSLPLPQAIELGDCLPVLVRGLYYESWNLAKQNESAPTNVMEKARHDIRGHQELAPAEKTLRACFSALNRLLPQDRMSSLLNAFPASIQQLWPEEEKGPGPRHLQDWQWT